RQLKLRISCLGAPCALFPPQYAKHSAGRVPVGFRQGLVAKLDHGGQTMAEEIITLQALLVKRYLLNVMHDQRQGHWRDGSRSLLGAGQQGDRNERWPCRSGSRAAFAATSCAGESLERAFHPGLDDDGSPLLNLGFY